MVYTSDLRGKHIIRDVHAEILKELENLGIINKIFLRIFDDPNEDNMLWEEGGLTFKDPDTGRKLGSNDAAWYYISKGKPIPLIVVESTFGTERGQFGDGQFNRFSHPLAPAKLGYTGVMLIPFKGESYVKNDGIIGFNSEFASMKYAYVNKEMIKSALGVCKKEKGSYLIMDFYQLDILKELVKESIKQNLGLKNSLTQVIKKIKIMMQVCLESGQKKSNSIKKLKKITPLFDYNGKEISNSFGIIFTHNFVSLSTSSKRDGHGLLGKTMSLYYIYPDEKMFSIFIRLDRQSIDELKRKKGKEVGYVFNNPNSIIISRDDLIFEDKKLEQKLEKIEEINMFKNRQTELIKQITTEIIRGKVRINDLFISR